MIRHVLDTDILSLFQQGHAEVVRHCRAAPPGTLAITVITVEEQFLGWYTRARQAKRDDEIVKAYEGMTAFAGFVRGLTILPLSASALQRYRQFQAKKIKVPKKDLSIAAIALDHNAAVVTRNSADFGRVPGLVIEDWSK
jgi:tRNA(fMet)-specific endonuclease VapC